MKRGRERKGREGKGRIGSRRRIGGCAAYIMTERVKDQGSERLQGWFKWKNQRSLPETSDRPDAEQKGGVKVFFGSRPNLESSITVVGGDQTISKGTQ